MHGLVDVSRRWAPSLCGPSVLLVLLLGCGSEESSPTGNTGGDSTGGGPGGGGGMTVGGAGNGGAMPQDSGAVASDAGGIGGVGGAMAGAGGIGGIGGIGGSSGVGGSTGGAAPSSVCGDLVVEGTEQCEDGNEIPGDGCENDCTYTCVPGPQGNVQCSDGNICNGVERCRNDFVCEAATPVEDGTPCGDSATCLAGECVDN